MLDLRLMVKFKNKKNLTKIKCSKQDKILLNILSEEYVPVEIIYVDYINLCNIECKKNGLFNCYYNDFENLLLKYLKFNIIEFNSF